MAGNIGQWACDKGDKVKHFYIRGGSEWASACNPSEYQVRMLTPGGKKKKCKACVVALAES